MMLLPDLEVRVFPKEAELQLRCEEWPGESEGRVKNEWSRQGEMHMGGKALEW